MPCTQCADGKWKWGETGACEFDSLEECQAAHPEETPMPGPMMGGKDEDGAIYSGPCLLGTKPIYLKSATLNSKGSAHAGALVKSGDVNTSADWSFSAEDGNALLGANGDDWANYAKWFLGVDSGEPENTKAHYKYPFGKNGKVYRAALTAIRQRAGQQNDNEVFARAGALIDAIDAANKAAAFVAKFRALSDRVYSRLELKAVDEATRTFTGLATTPTTDRMGDIVDPMGAQFSLPIPLLWQHDARNPIGWVTQAKPTKSGIVITGRIAQDPLLPELDKYWGYIRSGLVGGLSIGFDPKEFKPIEGTSGLLFSLWDWLELSVVTIPANQEATIATIKSADLSLLRAPSGDMRKSKVLRIDSLPGVPGATSSKGNSHPSTTPGKPMKTIKEQLEAFEARRAADVAALNAIMAKAAEEGRTLDETESQKYEELKTEIKQLDEHIVRLKEAQPLLTAAPVDSDPNADPTSQPGRTTTKSVTDPANPIQTSRPATPQVVFGKSPLPKGTAFTRYAIALALSKGNLMQAEQLATRWKDSTPEVGLVLKAAVAAGTTTDATWAGPLAPYQQMASEFIDLLRPETIMGRINGFRRVPFNISMPRTTAGTSAGWVGQGAPKPLTKMDFDTVQLPFHKIASIVVMTEELVRFSNPSAEAVVRADMIAAVAQFMDQQFLDPSVAAVGSTSPASISYGASNAAFAGTSIANATTDAAAAMASLSNNNIPLAGAVWIMHPRTALYLGMLRTTQDVFAFPGLGINGGTYFGLPVITSNNVPIDTGNDTFIFLLQPSEILVADDGGVAIDVSNQASVQMSDAPAAGAQSLVSFWQNNLIGLRAERYVTWLRRRDAAVYYVKDITY